jgi:hypothetical protein
MKIKKLLNFYLKNPDKINWDVLSNNKKAIELLIKNPDKN